MVQYHIIMVEAAAEGNIPIVDYILNILNRYIVFHQAF